MSSIWDPANAPDFGKPQWSDQSTSWPQQQPGYSDTHLTASPAAPPRPARNSALLMGGTAVGAVLCVIWTLLPWITVSGTDEMQSADGLHEFPDCLEICSPAPMSTWGLLLAVVAALTAVGCVIWLLTHRRAFACAVACGPPLVIVLTFVDLSALISNAQQATEANSPFQDSFDVTASPGWAFTALTSATIWVLSLIAVYRTRDIANRSQAGRIGPQPVLPVFGPSSDNLQGPTHYLHEYTQFTLPQSPCRQPADSESNGP